MPGVILGYVVRYVGVAVALLGTLAAAPGGVQHLGRVTRESVRAAVRTLRNLFRGPTALTGSAHLHVFAHDTAQGVDLDAVTRLTHLIDGLTAQVTAIEARFNDTTARLHALERDLDAARNRADTIDARALPVVGVGIVLLGLPDQIVTHHPLIDWVLIGVAFAAVASYVLGRRSTV